MADHEYRERFIQAVRLYMADAGLESLKDAAEQADIKYATLHKIMNRENFPTVDQAIGICEKGGFSANWLFLNKGSKYMAEILTLEKMAKKISSIEAKIK